MEWVIEGLGEVLRATADTEFRTAMGVLNFVLTITVFVAYTALFLTRAVVIAVWRLLMRLLELLFGIALGQPPPLPPLPSLPALLRCVLGAFAACVVTIRVAV